MSTSELSDRSRVTEVTNVTSIVVLSVIADEAAGGYVREIRVFGTPLGSSTEDVIFSLRLRAPTQDVLDIDVPASHF